MATRINVAAVSAYEADLSYAELKEPTLIPWVGDDSVLIDRFDALHLIQDLPSYTEASESESSEGDVDDAFSLSGDELHSFQQTKRRDQLAFLRSERVSTKAAQEQAPYFTTKSEVIPSKVPPRPPHEREEEPPAAIEKLMQHTAKALLASPDPAMLEMRIMTNHAQDKRFAFLRGKWPSAWTRIYKRPVVRAPALAPAAGLDLGLGYGSSDGEKGEEDEDVPPPPVLGREASTPPPDPDQVQRLRRERAKVWAESRKRRADDGHERL